MSFDQEVDSGDDLKCKEVFELIGRRLLPADGPGLLGQLRCVRCGAQYIVRKPKKRTVEGTRVYA